MRFIPSTLAAFLVAALAAFAAADSGPAEIVKLKIDEDAGFDRVNEPITMGVPLPEGRVDDPAKIGLLDATGKTIPCQVTEVARWLDGKSVKWAQLTWLQSVKAKASETVTVSLNVNPAGGTGGLPASGKTSLSAEVKDNVVTVQTGYVKFVVRGAKFNGIDGAWFDPTGKNKFDTANPIIPPGNTGGSVALSPAKDKVTTEEIEVKVKEEAVKKRLFKVNGDLTSYISDLDRDGKVVIEEQGPRRVVVKTTGRHMDDKGNKALDYIVRFYAYADSPIVRVSHTFTCAQGKEAKDLVFLSGLYMHIRTQLGGKSPLQIKTTLGTEVDPLVVTGPGQITQLASDAFTLDAVGQPVVEGKVKTTKPLTTGWADVSNGRLGLAVGVKWFWQMFPKAIGTGAMGHWLFGFIRPTPPNPSKSTWASLARTT